MTLIVFLLFYSKDRSNKLTKYLLQCYCVCVSLSLVVGGHDEIIFDILFQTKCKEVVRPRTSQCQWHIGLYNNKDYVVLMMLRKTLSKNPEVQRSMVRMLHARSQRPRRKIQHQLCQLRKLSSEGQHYAKDVVKLLLVRSHTQIYIVFTVMIFYYSHNCPCFTMKMQSFRKKH